MKRIWLLLCLGLVTFSLAGNALAATDWKFGASLRFATFWTEQYAGKSRMNDLEGGNSSLESDGLLTWSQQGNSRLRFTMKSDSLDGYIELGYNTANSVVTTRYYWGRYKFNDNLAITIGQADQLFSSDKISSQVWDADWAMVGLGTSKRSGTPKIILTAGGFDFALSQPEIRTKLPASSIVGGTTTADRDTYMPQIQASYQYKGDSFKIKAAGAFQNIKYNKIDNGTDAFSKNINSWLFGLDGNVNFGPLYLAGAFATGQNWVDANWNRSLSNYAGTKSMSNMTGQWDGNNYKSTTSFMFGLVAGYRLTEALRLEAGAGYRHDENDTWKTDSNMWNIYLQASYTITPGFRITPEIGYIDLGKTFGSKATDTKGIDAGYIWYAGTQWRMDF